MKIHPSQPPPSAIDFIGDVHGHASALENLLCKMGYTPSGRGYRPPNGHIAVFVGDLIDRGPDVPRVLEIVHAMHSEGFAKVIMGNHEYNALCFYTPGDKEGYIRSRKTSTFHQPEMSALSLASFPGLWDRYIEWFRTFPLYLDFGPIRCVHACWNKPDIERLAGRDFSSDGLLESSAVYKSDDFRMIERILKGPEINLPETHSVKDNDGRDWRGVRTRWWGQLHGESFKQLQFPQTGELPDILPDPAELQVIEPYADDEPMLIFGHYWCRAIQPAPIRHNLACIDYSVAKGGYLTAYRWEGEQAFSSDRFHSARPG